MTKIKSSLGFKYPTLRDSPLKTSRQWLEGRKLDDNAEGLWRIHNNLYDLNPFIVHHPGGKEWLELTEGTDITEAFETHHLKGIAETILSKYLVRSVTTPRNSPFHFNDDGFYRTLKQKVMKQLPDLPPDPVRRSKVISDGFVVCFFVSVAIAGFLGSFIVGTLSGLLLALNAIVAHNFFHQKNNFRMYYFDLSLLESKSWRISHAMSHHLFTNTINDLEITFFEPFLHYLPIKKPIYLQYLISPFVIALIVFGNFANRLVEVLLYRKDVQPTLLLPYTTLALLLAVGGEPSTALCLFGWIQAVMSAAFGAIGVNAAHHHPEIFHDGDAPRPPAELDWGVHQLDAVADKREAVASHFLALVSFGDHALHHLFPTLDHGLLPALYPTFIETCKQFGVEWRVRSQCALVKGQFRLLGKEQPNAVRPKALKASF